MRYAVALLSVILLHPAYAELPTISKRYLRCTVMDAHVGYMKLDIKPKTSKKHPRQAYLLEIVDYRNLNVFMFPVQEKYKWKASLASDGSIIQLQCKMEIKTHKNFKASPIVLSARFDENGKGVLETNQDSSMEVNAGGPVYPFQILGLTPATGKVVALRPYNAALVNVNVNRMSNQRIEICGEGMKSPLVFELKQSGQPERVLLEETPFQYTWSVADKKAATAKLRALPSAKIETLVASMEEAAIRPARKIDTPERIKRCRLLLKFKHPFPIPIKGQRQRGNSLPDNKVEVVIDVSMNDPAPTVATGFLQADLFANCDHPAVRKAAQKAVTGAESDMEKAVRLTHEVYRLVQFEPRPGLPVASDSLKYGAGDCTEHSTVYAAMARSLGLPTKIVAGLVYRDGRFRYHAWNEVSVQLPGKGRVWLPQDPSLGLSEVDATHIKLIEGNVDRQLMMGPLIGTLEIEVLEAE
jgi:Transglutaminase-like superfamily